MKESQVHALIREIRPWRCFHPSPAHELLAASCAPDRKIAGRGPLRHLQAVPVRVRVTGSNRLGRLASVLAICVHLQHMHFDPLSEECHAYGDYGDGHRADGSGGTYPVRARSDRSDSDHAESLWRATRYARQFDLRGYPTQAATGLLLAAALPAGATAAAALLDTPAAAPALTVTQTLQPGHPAGLTTGAQAAVTVTAAFHGLARGQLTTPHPHHPAAARPSRPCRRHCRTRRNRHPQRHRR
jgi:hypothetical protein